MRAGRAAAFAVLVIALAWIGWLVVQTTRADQLARSDPEAALRLEPDHPGALLALALQQIAKGDDVEATATARHLLRVAPGQGDAFAVIALAAARRHAPDAEKLLEIAIQRAPRISQVRAQLATLRLQADDPAGAMVQLDVLLRLKPQQGVKIFPAIAQQSLDPRFADALAARLALKPRWRRGFLEVLNARGSPHAIDNIYSRLQAKGGMTREETARWLDGMLAKGRWGDAFAAWFGTLDPPPSRLPSVRNGSFEDDIDGLGFGWRNDTTPGAFTDIEAGAGRKGSRAAHFHFIGRPAARGNLRQALLLSPGRYRLSLQARAEFLQSEQGMQWAVRCDKGAQIAATDGMEGSFDWRGLSVEFDVPATGCDGQWLELGNPAVGGSAQRVEGDLWTDDVAITAMSAR